MFTSKTATATTVTCALVLFCCVNIFVIGVPIIDVASSSLNRNIINLNGTSTDSLEDDTNSTANGTHRDLYVIKAVVYEIGILTEVNDSDTDAASAADDFSHERVDLTFFDAKSNGSHLDLGSIPLPVQTNITGQVLTGIAPVHIGAIQDAHDIIQSLPLTGTIVNISHSDTSFVTLTHRPHDGENGTILDAADLARIPGLDANAIQIDRTGGGRSMDDDSDDE